MLVCGSRQTQALDRVLWDCDGPVEPDELAMQFTRDQRDVVAELLQARSRLGWSGGKFES